MPPLDDDESLDAALGDNSGQNTDAAQDENAGQHVDAAQDENAGQNVDAAPAPTITTHGNKRARPTTSFNPHIVQIDDEEVEDIDRETTRASCRRRLDPSPSRADVLGSVSADTEPMTSERPVQGDFTLPTSPSFLDESDGMGFIPQAADSFASPHQNQTIPEETANPDTPSVWCPSEELFNITRLDAGFTLPNGFVVRPGYQPRLGDNVPVNLLKANLLKGECFGYQSMSPDTCVERQAYFLNKVPLFSSFNFFYNLSFNFNPFIFYIFLYFSFSVVCKCGLWHANEVLL